MKTFVISDTHFGHTNIIKYIDRPFTDVKQMDDTMIERWNSVVGPDDWVWHLGDFAFTKDKDECRLLFDKLNGHKALIVGNHDSPFVRKCLPWREVHYLYDLKWDGMHVILCHYPIEEWNRKHHKAIHLHGHVHQKTKPM